MLGIIGDFNNEWAFTLAGTACNHNGVHKLGGPAACPQRLCGGVASVSWDRPLGTECCQRRPYMSQFTGPPRGWDLILVLSLFMTSLPLAVEGEMPGFGLQRSSILNGYLLSSCTDMPHANSIVPNHPPCL